MDWFESLTGFSERDYADTRSKFAVEGDRLTSRVNGQSWSIGEFEVASLAELRRRAASLRASPGRPTVRIVHGDVRKMQQSDAGTLRTPASCARAQRS